MTDRKPVELMDDRELLELAAKAAGIDDSCEWDEYSECMRYKYKTEGDMWDPLAYDGDALRLAVKLELEINTSQMAHWGKNTYISDFRCRSRGLTGYGHVPHGQDGYAATRFAIVRAAAKIGKDMK